MGLSISIVRRWGVICAKGRVVISQVLRRGGRDLGHPVLDYSPGMMETGYSSTRTAAAGPCVMSLTFTPL